MAEVDDGGPATARDLLRFIPTVLVRQLAHQGTKVGFREGKVPIHAAFVFLDISGLHQLPAGESPAGALDVLAAAFRLFAHIARQHGGDLIKFTGDSLLLLWQYKRDDAEGARRAGMAAAECALDLVSVNGQTLWDASGGASLPGELPKAAAAASDEAAAGSSPTLRSKEDLQAEQMRRLGALLKGDRQTSGFEAFNQGHLVLLLDDQQAPI